VWAAIKAKFHWSVDDLGRPTTGLENTETILADGLGPCLEHEQ